MAAILRCVVLLTAGAAAGGPVERVALTGALCVAICLILNNFLESYLFRTGDKLGYLFIFLMLHGEAARLRRQGSPGGSAVGGGDLIGGCRGLAPRPCRAARLLGNAEGLAMAVSSLAGFAIRAAGVALMTIVTVAFTRLMGAEYGRLAFLLSGSFIVVLFAGLGLPTASSRLVPRLPGPGRPGGGGALPAWPASPPSTRRRRWAARSSPPPSRRCPRCSAPTASRRRASWGS